MDDAIASALAALAAAVVVAAGLAVCTLAAVVLRAASWADDTEQPEQNTWPDREIRA